VRRLWDDLTIAIYHLYDHPSSAVKEMAFIDRAATRRSWR